LYNLLSPISKNTKKEKQHLGKVSLAKDN
jgi:hypothetical protein